MAQRNSDGVKKRANGTYRIRPRDASGKRLCLTFDRAKDARAALDGIRTAIRNREYVSPAKIPTVEQAAHAWLDGKKVSESRSGGPLKESTLEFWQNHIDNFIVPTLGPYRMDVVDTALVEKQRDAWKALGLTAPSVNKVMTTLSAIFNKQLALRALRFNPVALAERMARGSNEVGTGDEIDGDPLEVRPEEVYGPEQLRRLLQSASPGFAHTILMTFALTGMRHGEALGLMWRDIDFDQREISVRRNWSSRYRNGEPVFWTPKTKQSVRKIHISDEHCLAFKRWKLQCSPSKWDLIFPKGDGRPQDRKTTWRAMDAAIKKANENTQPNQKLRRLTVHSLRHSFASIHLMNGTPIAEVSSMLGHANVNITLTVYTHFIQKMSTDSSSRLAALIFSPDQVGHNMDTSGEQVANS